MPVPPLLERRDVIGVLARLDHRAVPRLQRGARATARGLAWPFRALRRGEDRVVPGLVRWASTSWRTGMLVAATLAVLGSAVHLQRYPELRDEQRAADAASREQTVRIPGAAAGSPALPGGSQSVGPVRGKRLADHVEARRSELAAAAGDERRLAVVSFEEYLSADEVDALLPAGVTLQLAQYRLPAEGEAPLETEVVAGDLAGSVDRAVEQAITPIIDEIGEVESLLASGTIDDEAFEADLERRLSELEAVRNLLDTGHRVVFAVVVEGTVDTLRSVAERDRVRLVDLAPGETDVETSAFYGILPEDRERASFGADR